MRAVLLSPLALVLAAVGLVIGWFAGSGSLAVAVAFAIVGWAVGVGVGLGLRSAALRSAPRLRIDPFTLNEPWRRSVQDALQARNRFRAAVGRSRSGPFRERLEELADRIDHGVDECWQVAQQGQEIADARRRIERPAVEGKLEALLADGEPTPDSAADQTVEALRSQLGSAERLDHTVADTRARLTLLTARLDEAAARAMELTVAAGAAVDLAGLDTEVDALVTDMEALRLALEEVDDRPVPPPELPGSSEQATG
ncbi:MAG: hypothetical protein ACRD29_12695 [Acidimicrobiales bacterium]